MAINIKLSTKDTLKSYGDDIIAKRFENQTPLDFVLTYIERLEDLTKFYNQFDMKQYNDFYNNKEYRLYDYVTVLKTNGYIAATRTDCHDMIDTLGDYNNDFSHDFFRTKKGGNCFNISTTSIIFNEDFNDDFDKTL